MVLPEVSHQIIIYLKFGSQCCHEMNFKINFLFFILSLFLLPFAVSAQVSTGGTPIQIVKEKSASSNSDLVIMPTVDNLKMRKLYSQTETNKLKPLRFAHPFQVSLSPKNSGKWYSDGEYNVWQLRIRSTGAYSLNLIFNRFHLPENARLFLISETTGEVKGAYTAINNSESQTLAIEPVEGDEITVQYEEPVQVSSPGELLISQVAHDFIGVSSSGTHRPLGISGSCNVNVNCDAANGTEEIRDAVCRIIIEGIEICTGSMVNNTALDGTPYVITANHCINSETKAQTSIFLFNYESPYCSSIDGDVSRSMSGSSLKASFDSLDFALVRLNSTPPFNYRTYLLGWNRSNVAPLSSICIHHPLGDIKKYSFDKDAAVTANFTTSYRPSAFWNVRHWEIGVTEQGSSGGPLLNQDKQLVGTLTGGSATCSVPTNDYFEKFALAWNYRKETNKQLKAWLDPLNSNVTKLDGMYLNSGSSFCIPKTNFKDADVYATPKIVSGTLVKGYWSGSNSAGFANFAEQYKFSKNCDVNGISLGIAKVKTKTSYNDSFLEVEVYSGTDKPETLIYSEQYNVKYLYPDAMNYLKFTSSVKTTGNFFVGFSLSSLHSGDTLVVYMADRKLDVTNSYFVKNSTGWLKYNSQNLSGNGSALLTELIACNIEYPLGVTLPETVSEVQFYPNPLYGNVLLTVQTNDAIECPEDVSVYDLLGKKLNVSVSVAGVNSLRLNFAGKKPGIYFVHVEAGGKLFVGKIAYMP
jgi:hypothetical protein